MKLEDGLVDVPAGKIAAVVTYLDMRAPPDPGSGTIAPDGLGIRHVPNPDVDWYRDLYRRVGEDWLWFSRLKLAREALAAIIQHPAVSVSALTADGDDVGLLELDFRTPGACELAFFGVVPAQIGRGAGRFLMAEATRQAWARPIERFWVHTCTLDHPGALQFYIRSGFQPYRRQIELAADPRLEGVLERSAAPHVPLIDP